MFRKGRETYGLVTFPGWPWRATSKSCNNDQNPFRRRRPRGRVETARLARKAHTGQRRQVLIDIQPAREAWLNPTLVRRTMAIEGPHFAATVAPTQRAMVLLPQARLNVLVGGVPTRRDDPAAQPPPQDARTIRRLGRQFGNIAWAGRDCSAAKGASRGPQRQFALVRVSVDE